MIGPEARRGSLGECAGAAGAAVSAPLPGVPAASFLRSDFLRFGAGVAASAGGAGLAVSAAGTAPASAAGTVAASASGTLTESAAGAVTGLGAALAAGTVTELVTPLSAGAAASLRAAGVATGAGDPEPA